MGGLGGGESGEVDFVAEVVLGDGPGPHGAAYKNGVAGNAKDGGEFAAGGGKLGGEVGEAEVGAAGTTEHDGEGDVVGRGALGEKRGGEEHAEDVALLATGHKQAEAVERVGDLGALVAKK